MVNTYSPQRVVELATGESDMAAPVEEVLQQTWLLSEHKNAAYFARSRFGILMDDWQIAVASALANRQAVAVRAANGSGKTFLSAMCVLWWLFTRRPSRVITTASTWRQVTEQLWAEILSLHRRAYPPLGGSVTKTAIHLSPEHYAIGFSTRDPGLFEGFHGQNILVVLDEAKSIGDEIFEAVDRVLSTGDARLLVVSTPPTQKRGGFYNCFTRWRGRFATFHVPAKRVPSTPWVAGRVNRQWVERIVKEYGDQHPFTQSAVYAEFTEASEDVVVPVAWLEACVGAPTDLYDGYPLTMGVDVARSLDGGENVIALARGGHVVEIVSWHDDNLMSVTGKIAAMMRRYDVAPFRCYVDMGGMGAGVVDRLRELGLRVNGVNFGERSGSAQYRDKAAVMWGELRSRALQQYEAGRLGVSTGSGLVLPRDDKLLAQLSTRRWLTESDGRFRLESKEEMARRGLASPDRADAVALAVWGGSGVTKVAVAAGAVPKTDEAGGFEHQISALLREAGRRAAAEVSGGE